MSLFIKRVIKGKRGSLTLESLVVLPVFIFFCLVLLSLMRGPGLEDYVHQEVLIQIKELELINLAYDKLDLDALEGLDHMLTTVPQAVRPYLQVGLDLGKGQAKAKILEGYLDKQLKDLTRLSGLESIEISHFDLGGSVLQVEVVYVQNLPLGLSRQRSLSMTKNLWSLGDEPDLLGQEPIQAPGEDQVVYVTRTGQRYHLLDCFYINRQGTDQAGIRQLMMDMAEDQGYGPCSSCILKEWSPWK